MNIANLKLIIVSIGFSKRIKAVWCSSKEVSHQLVHLYMNNTERHMCAYCAFFYKTNRPQYKWKVTEYNMTLCIVGYHSGSATVQDSFALTHHK